MAAVAALDSALSAKNYADFKKNLAASACSLCALSEKRTNIVIDRGNPASKVLIIGEAPGANEDLTGKPFVGRAGKLLDQMLGEAGFSTETQSLVVNIAKCRPPDNRPPTRDEAQSCLPFLRKQIELMRPRIILLLGATALKYFEPEVRKPTPLKDRVGNFFEHPDFPGVKIFTVFHPAYLLRDPRKKTVMAGHLKKFMISFSEL